MINTPVAKHASIRMELYQLPTLKNTPTVIALKLVLQSSTTSLMAIRRAQTHVLLIKLSTTSTERPLSVLLTKIVR